MGTILFFDDWSLCHMENVKRVMGKPKWIKEATLEDSLTEGTWNFPCVWHDEAEQKWKAIYCAALPDGPKTPAYYPRSQALMYAESDDGYAWKKVDVTKERIGLGDSPYKNQVFGVKGHIDGAPVVIDEYDPQRRFKYLFARDGRQGMAASPDGIRWEIVKDVEIGDYTLDSPITYFYNHYRKSYCISRRLHCGDRRVAFMETTDWKNFSKPEVIIHPDPEDLPLIQFYGMPVYRYESLYIGLLWRLHCHPTEQWLFKGAGGAIDCALAYSLDGWHFNRATHNAFIECNERGEHGGGCVYTGCMVTDEKNGLIRFYSGGSKAEHFQDQELNDAALMLHTLRLDGFFRIESYVMRGRIMTRTVSFAGAGLKLNVRAPHGQVRVQMMGEDDKPVEGFTFEDCIPFIGDELYWQPVWKSGKTVDMLINKGRYHIDIELVNAEIYAIRGDFQMDFGWGGNVAPLKYEV